MKPGTIPAPPTIMVQLENWFVVYKDVNFYQSPETRSKYLVGNCYGHPRNLDGQQVHTSSLIELDIDKRIAKTASGTTYTLGKPDAGYVLAMAK